MRLSAGIISLYVGILAVAGLVWMVLLFGAMGSTSKLPLGGVVATVSRDSRDQFLEDLKKFASENGFICTAEVIPPDNEDVAIEMHRSDMRIIGGNTPDDKAKINLAFYKNGFFFISEPLPQAKVDAVMVALRESLRQVKGVTSEIQRQ